METRCEVAPTEVAPTATTQTATTQTEATPAARWSVGGRFLDALGRRDFDAMADCLDPSVRFRGLVTRGPIDGVGRDAVMPWLRKWFDGPDALEIVDATVGEVGPKLYLRWRVTMSPGTPGAAVRLVEQHVFATIDGSIVSFDLLCSGFSELPHP